MKKLLLSSLFFVFTLQAYSTDYYFSSSGNNVNPGTRNLPYQTIVKLNKLTLNVGDHVFFKR